MEKTFEDKFDETMSMLKVIEKKLIDKVNSKNIIQKPVTDKKNSHLHMLLETSLMNKVEKQAKEKGVSIAEFVRKRLRESEQLDRIESKIDTILCKR